MSNYSTEIEIKVVANYETVSPLVTWNEIVKFKTWNIRIKQKLTLASMYSTRLSKVVNFSFKVANLDLHDISKKFIMNLSLFNKYTG